jgi:hypothetical protein
MKMKHLYSCDAVLCGTPELAGDLIYGMGKVLTFSEIDVTMNGNIIICFGGEYVSAEMPERVHRFEYPMLPLTTVFMGGCNGPSVLCTGTAQDYVENIRGRHNKPEALVTHLVTKSQFEGTKLVGEPRVFVYQRIAKPRHVDVLKYIYWLDNDKPAEYDYYTSKMAHRVFWVDRNSRRVMSEPLYRQRFATLADAVAFRTERSAKRAFHSFSQGVANG